MTTPQQTNPPEGVQYAKEDITWGIDLSAVTTTPTNVTTNLTWGAQTITLVDLPSVSGSVVSQRVRAQVLTPSAAPYTLTVTYTPSGTTDILVAIFQIVCPQ